MRDHVIDLRSDTVTKPSAEMRRAMAEAEVGDDVFGDDPTVIALEERAAEITGKEAALFVASGTMGNLVSLMAQVPRGGEIIAGEGNHSFAHEAGNFAVVVGATMKTLPWDEDGRMDPDQIRRAFRNPHDVHEPLTSLVALENTHSDSMAQPLPADYAAAIARVAHDGGVPLHVDGARIFNASAALATPVSRLLEHADSATFCLSKGLACPVGSVVVGSKELIWRARRARKLVGGGMRQVGVLAAPGLIALRDGPTGMIERLADDHANARRLANGLADLPGIVGLEPGARADQLRVHRPRAPRGATGVHGGISRRGRTDDRVPGQHANTRCHPLRHRGLRHRRDHRRHAARTHRGRSCACGFRCSRRRRCLTLGQRIRR